MDLFKRKNSREATSMDFYDKNVIQNTKIRGKDKRMLHKLARCRIKRDILNEEMGE